VEVSETAEDRFGETDSLEALRLARFWICASRASEPVAIERGCRLAVPLFLE
jgi:hypothetical protein